MHTQNNWNHHADKKQKNQPHYSNANGRVINLMMLDTNEADKEQKNKHNDS